MAVKNKVEIRIAGKEYTLVGVESDEYIQKIGLYIDKKMNEIMRVNSKLSTSMAAVLTAINVADDYYKSHHSDGTHSKELKLALAEIEKLKAANLILTEERTDFASRNSNLQLELAKREAELQEVRNSIEKSERNRKQDEEGY